MELNSTPAAGNSKDLVDCGAQVAGTSEEFPHHGALLCNLGILSHWFPAVWTCLVPDHL